MRQPSRREDSRNQLLYTVRGEVRLAHNSCPWPGCRRGRDQSGKGSHPTRVLSLSDWAEPGPGGRESCLLSPRHFWGTCSSASSTPQPHLTLGSSSDAALRPHPRPVRAKHTHLGCCGLGRAATASYGWMVKGHQGARRPGCE